MWEMNELIRHNMRFTAVRLWNNDDVGRYILCCKVFSFYTFEI